MIKKAYENTDFLNSSDGRSLRILSEYLEPKARLNNLNIANTIVFFGSARIKSAEKLNDNSTFIEKENAKYYVAAKELSKKLTEWSNSLSEEKYIICTGGGPGIMEAANSGAFEAGGKNIGFSIFLPHEQKENKYITKELNFEFNYFFMRKFWFAYLAKILVAFPGGFGTLDELFEMLTLIQTKKMDKKSLTPVFLYGKEFWNKLINFDLLIDYGYISKDDMDLIKITDNVDEAFELITGSLVKIKI